MTENMKWVRYGLREIASKGRGECMDSCRIDISEALGRYIATERNACSVATYRPNGTHARSLRSDRAGQALGRYVTTVRPYLGFSPMSRVSSAKVFPPSSLESWIERRDSSARFGDLGKDRRPGRSSDSDFFCRSAGLRRRPSFLLRETSSSKSREGAGSSCVPDTSVLPAGSYTTPILVEDKERAAESMPPPSVRKDIVLALRAPNAAPVAQPKGQKRKFTKGGDGESSQQGGSSLVSELRGKFMSLIDGMISECGSEASHLAGELSELQGSWSKTEAMLTAFKDSHSAKVSKLEAEIGEFERDLGKTAISLFKEKKTKKAKTLEVRRLQCHIEGDVGLASCRIREATYALRSKFQARLAKISAFLCSFECIRSRDSALATIEGWMAVVRAFQSETPSSLEAEETRLSDGKGDLVVVDGDFDLVLADLKSACFLPTCSEDLKGKDPVVGENGGDAAQGLDKAMGEEGA
ncbi:hypothetical protein IGI04_002439 [Brassica rapa subsp. trilocularis]|uniref:DUF632 domain-containing protein n=1 Tax=Brassica rapa subsp. trilocularis TaxID=1813537 RepID=A0ABQ7NVJ5_BRACM|nr:hypothetical protein IGI04_002439 [Brassica rapa subsp. trilocularis]